MDDLRSFFQGDSLNSEERKRLFIFSIIFTLFILLEIMAVLVSIYELNRSPSQLESTQGVLEEPVLKNQ